MGRVLTLATLFYLFNSGLVDAATIGFDGMDRPSSITDIEINGTTYNASISWDVIQSNPGQPSPNPVGDLQDGDINEAITDIAALLNLPANNQWHSLSFTHYIDFLVNFPFTPSLPEGDYDTGGNVSLSGHDDIAVADLFDANLTDFQAPIYGVIQFTEVSESAVPEPNGLLLFCLASIGYLAAQRHKKQRQATLTTANSANA